MRDFGFELSYQTEYKIYNAKLEILSNMAKNKVKVTPVLNIDEIMPKTGFQHQKSVIKPTFIPPPYQVLGLSNK